MEKGNYIIAFEYDTDKYMVTKYQAKGVNSDKNSDAVKADRTIDGVSKTVAVTDAISLDNSIANIDLGLTDMQKFDLSIEKSISKVIVTNSKGTETYNYKDENLAKAEIKSKYLSGSNVVIEYKMKITNNGEIAGYAKNIVDNLPSSLKFNSNLNKDWYQKDGNLYNTSLAETKIEPGETKEVTLILTKLMTNSNTGLTNNKAKITSSSNSLGIEDSNKDNEESSADIIITVSTGGVVNYIILITLALAIICGTIYIIKRKITK